MLSQGAFLSGTAGGPGTYTTTLDFSDGSKAQYLAVGDVITDKLGAQYSVTTWGIFPSNFSNSGTVTVTPLGADVAPTDSTVLSDASVATPGQVDLSPQVQTDGALGSSVLIEGRTYKYSCSASFAIAAQENLALVGDRFLDNTGKVFEITALSGQPGAFAQPFDAVEVDKIGDSPNVGPIYLYRPTPNKGFYQGEVLNPLAEDEVRNRDELLTDLCFDSIIASGAGAIPPSEILVIASGSGNVTNTSTLILVTESGAATVVLQPPFDDGKILYIKDAFDGATDRGVNTITVIPPSGETVDHNATASLINATQSLTLALSSGVWYLL